MDTIVGHYIYIHVWVLSSSMLFKWIHYLAIILLLIYEYHRLQSCSHGYNCLGLYCCAYISVVHFNAVHVDYIASHYIAVHICLFSTSMMIIWIHILVTVLLFINWVFWTSMLFTWIQSLVSILLFIYQCCPL